MTTVEPNRFRTRSAASEPGLTVETSSSAITTHFPGYVRRPGLIARLRECRDYPLVAVTAPAGYGKSSVLAEWAEDDERPFAWLTLDSQDNHAPRLLKRMAEAMNGLSSAHGPCVLVTDDAQVLRTKSAFEALEEAIADLPKGAQVAVASRKQLGLPLGRMRTRHEVFELFQRDLALTAAESREMLEAIGLTLSPEDARVIHDRTEGWPAALYLAGLSLGQGPDEVATAREFRGDDRFVADYFRDEFLNGTSVARVRFLRRSAILEDLSGPICDEVLERSGSARVLQELARSNKPVEWLDHGDGSYRYHPLFKQMMCAELHRHEPDVELRLHERASDWYAAHEQFEEAIGHSIAAGNDDRAGELIWARAAPSLAAGDRETVRDWLDRFSDRKIAGSPRLALVAAHLYLALGEGALGLHWASVARSGFDEEALEDPDLMADLLLLKATLPVDGIEQMGSDAMRAAELHPPESPWRAIACFYAGVARQLTGDSQGARDLLEEGARRGSATGPLVHVFCLTQLTLLHLDEDDLENALRVVAQAREQLARFDLGAYPVMAFAYVASALAHSSVGRIDEAVSDRGRAIEMLAKLNGFPDWFQAQARVFLARVCVHLDDPPGAREHLDQAAALVTLVPDGPTLRRWLGAAEAAVSTISNGEARTDLTPAELRTLQFLPTHLSFREIGERSFVSPNTVKTQAQAIYRKLDASSRAEAVERAREVGLLSDVANG